MKSGDELRVVMVVPLLAVLVAAAAWFHGSAVETGRAVDTPSHVPLEYLPSTSSARLLSMGHAPALADIFWVRSILYFANELETRQSFEWLIQYMDVVISLDPDFDDVYQWGGTVLVLASKKVTYEDVARANEILERGARHFPDNWRLPEAAAANCSYYVEDPPPDVKLKLEACREKFINMAASRPGAPYTMTLLAASLAGGDEQRACQLLIEAYFSRPQDPTLREQVERRMTGGLCGQVSAEELRRQDTMFRQAHERLYPYLPADLVVHVVDLRPPVEPPTPGEGPALEEIDGKE